jgi:hypothetical protein
MKIDPNQPILLIRECVLCQDGRVLLHDGRSTPEADLDHEGNAFRDFCGSVDPNRAFIAAFIPEDTDREVFFRARNVALQMGRHMQSTVETPEQQIKHWAHYVAAKRTADAGEEES